MAFSVRKQIGQRREILEVPGDGLSIGCAPDANITLSDPKVGSLHARIQKENEKFIITDNDSPTGTFVNGNPIERSRQLVAGDQIRIGECTFSVSIDGDLLTLAYEEKPQTPGNDSEDEAIDYVGAYSLHAKLYNPRAISWGILVVSILPIALWLMGAKFLSRPGGVSVAHARIGNQCVECHDTWRGPSKLACEKCHLGPVHHANQAFEPSCVSCHAEHRGMPMLALVDNRGCTQCHGALKTKDPKTQASTPSRDFASVTDFVKDHPEFGFSVRDQDDSGRAVKDPKVIQRVRLDAEGKKSLTPPKEDDKLAGFNKKLQGAIRLNHFAHLDKPIARKSDDDKVQLSCGDCHTIAADGRRMQKIAFTSHCAGCHQERDLKIDPKANDKKLAACTVPHGSEERVRNYLTVFFTEKQCQPLPASEPDPRLLMSALKGAPAQSVQKDVLDLEQSLYRDRGCAYCHQVDREAQPWPKVVYARIPERWFEHAEFDHKKHRLVKCEECHRGFGWRIDGPANEKKLVLVNPRESTETEDVLIPGIATCRNCHRESRRSGGQIEGTAPTACGACHFYHDKTKEKDWKGKLSVDLKAVPENHNNNKVAP